jgi:hypothetical protein
LYLGLASRATLEDCELTGNGAGGPYGAQGSGGAIFASSDARLRVRRCRFEQNGAIGFEGGPGGAVAANAVEVEIEDCVFDNNGGCCGAVSLWGGGKVDRCIFTRSMSAYGGSAVFLDGPGRVSNSVFTDNFGVLGATIVAGQGAVIEGNTISFNEGHTGGGGIAISAGVDVARNIVSSNVGAGIIRWGSPPDSGRIRCNDVWNNREGSTQVNYSGLPDLTGIDGNFSVDPSFCDTVARDLHLTQSSPCVSHGDCGQIGALGVGCNVSPVGPWSPTSVSFLPPRPNPARGAVSLAFVLPEPAWIRLDVIDAAGRRIATIADGPAAAGRNERMWPARVPVGIYHVVLDVQGERSVHRLVVLE